MAGVIIDIYFDYLLMQTWKRYSHTHFNIVFAKLEQNLTKTIKEQLDAPSLAAFNQTQKQYGTKQLLESVSKKTVAAQNGGAFTAKEWISTLSGDKFTKGKVSTGTAPFQKEAQKVNNMSQKIAENTKK